MTSANLFPVTILALASAGALAAQGGALPNPGRGAPLTPVTALLGATPPQLPPTSRSGAAPADPLVIAQMPAAEAGDINAQLRLAMLYIDGHSGPPRDYAQAIAWVRKAVDQGSGAGAAFYAAEAELGRLTLLGCGTPPDPPSALPLLSDAAAHGSAPAMSDLALAYMYGWGVAQNYSTAAIWAENAINAGGAPSAETVLGALYLEGWGLAQDFDRAATLFSQASQQGDDDAAVKLAEMYMYGIGVNMDFQQARQWASKASGRGNPLGEYVMAQLYWRPQDGRRDLRLAAHQIRLAAEAGYPAAEGLLAVYLTDGLGVRPDAKEAIRWATVGAANGDVSAKRYLAHLQAGGGPG